MKKSILIKKVISPISIIAIIGSLLVYSLQANLFGQENGSQQPLENEFTPILPPSKVGFIPPPPPPNPPYTPTKQEFEEARQLRQELKEAKKATVPAAPDTSPRQLRRKSKYEHLERGSNLLHDSLSQTEKAGEFFRKKVMQREGFISLVLIESTVQRDPISGEEFIISERAMVANELLVRINPEASFEAFSDYIEAQGGIIVESVGSVGYYLVSFEYAGPDTISLAQQKLRENSENIGKIEPNFILMLDSIPPDDTLFDDQWGMHNTGQEQGEEDIDIDAPGGWNIVTDAEDIIVAVVDSGARLTHDDLKLNLWVNDTEDNGTSGVDDDGNGRIDDIHGFDIYNNDGDPTDGYGHGSHVAGIIGAKGDNGKGVAGVAWNVQLMIVRSFNNIGAGTSGTALNGMKYARNNGAHIINMSYSFSGEIEAICDELDDGKSEFENLGTWYVAAAGNQNKNIDYNFLSPGSCDSDTLITVAAVDRHGDRWSSSNWGATTVHIAAPGVDIYSAWKNANNDYEEGSGTSAAAPHVSGAAALLRQLFPFDDYDDFKNRIMWTAKPLDWNEPTVTDGMLDLDGALYIWSNAEDIGGGWKELDDWFNAFKDADYPWIWHEDQGWWWSDDISTADIWFWDEEMAWIWTAEDKYPIIWRNSDGVWLGYNDNPQTEDRDFYNYSTKQWEQIPISGTSGSPPQTP